MLEYDAGLFRSNVEMRFVHFERRRNDVGGKTIFGSLLKENEMEEIRFLAGKSYKPQAEFLERRNIIDRISDIVIEQLLGCFPDFAKQFIHILENPEYRSDGASESLAY